MDTTLKNKELKIKLDISNFKGKVFKSLEEMKEYHNEVFKNKNLK